MPPPYIDPEDEDAVAAYWAQQAEWAALMAALYPPVVPPVWLSDDPEEGE